MQEDMINKKEALDHEKENNPEISEQEPEKSEEKEPSIRLSEIDTDIAKRQENIVDTENKLDAVRGELGLSEMTEVPPSILASQNSIDKLNHEKENLEGGNDQKQEENQEQMKELEADLENALRQMETQAKLMLDALYERQQQRFTPLQNGEQFQQMASIIKNLSRVELKNLDENKLNSIANDVDGLSNLMNQIDQRPTGGQVIDNPDNLGKLMQGTKQFGDANLMKGKVLLSKNLENPKLDEAKRRLGESFHRLSERTSKVFNLAGRMREVLSGYR